MSTFTPRIDVLPTAQQRLWPLLRRAAGLGFVLYGGTAIGLRLGHRPSVDFDFFSGAGVSLSRGLAAARLLFGPNFQPSESLKELVYFEDGDLATLTPADKATLVAAAHAVRDLPQVTLASRQLVGTHGM